MSEKWTILFTKKAEKDFAKLASKIQKRIYNALREKLEKDPDKHLINLTGNKKGSYKFRVGDYRLICKKEYEQIIILILKIKHRREVYR